MVGVLASYFTKRCCHSVNILQQRENPEWMLIVLGSEGRELAEGTKLDVSLLWWQAGCALGLWKQWSLDHRPDDSLLLEMLSSLTIPFRHCTI